LNYGSVNSKGFYATDTVCLIKNVNATTCTKNFDIFIQMWQEGMPNNITGIAGLGIDNSGKFPNLIKTLKSNKIITNSVFCFQLTEMNSNI